MTTTTASIEVLTPEDVLGIGHGSDILIVDDDQTNLVAYEAALTPLGRTVVLARSGAEALGRLLEQDFALVLLDVSMPGMTGIETARMIRQRPRNKATPIIFITGASSNTELVVDAYETGAFDFLIKPILPEILRAKASVYLQLQERTQQLLKLAQQKVTATRAAHTLEKLQEATARLSEARTPGDVAEVAVGLGADACNAVAGAMWCVQPDGSLVLERSHNIPEAYLNQWRVIPANAPVISTRIITSRDPVWVENAADFAREAPESFERAKAAGRAWAFAALPLVSHGQAIAMMTFSFQGEHRFSDEERSFLLSLVRTCEQALERSRLYVAEAAARQAAEALNARKDEFLAMLGHELRNPLAAIVSAVDLIRLRAHDHGRELSILDRQISHLTHIVGDLVDVARITQGKISLRREAVSVATAINDAVQATRPLIDVHQITISVPDDLLIDGDRDRLGQVLANLLSNAAKYTPSGGHIQITATAIEPECARIEVRDNGRGIPATLQSNLFDLFVQGERAADRHEGGLGIGLTLARTIVELHGGTIEAHSDGVGTGATFAVQLPRATSKTATAEVPVNRPITNTSLRILVVDDNADAAEMLAAVIGSLGHDVALAHDGQQGLEVAEKLAPQIALLDIGLPIIDGYELATRLRELPGCRNTMLIAVTGYGQPEDRERSKRAGFQHHLVKPVELATLRTLLVAADDDGGSR